MKTATFMYPESLLALLNQSAESFEGEARTAMAMKLFELGRLTSGQAATIAGMGRVDFLLRCQTYGVASVEWDEDDIQREVEVA
jgi:predicted HTH domain antitoxin